DLYKGDCRGCVECCSRFLPVSPFDRVRLEAYVRRNGIEPSEPSAEYDLLCPYVFRQVKIDKYVCRISTPSCWPPPGGPAPSRPEICRAYRCDRHKRGELGMFFGAGCAEVTDMRELAESMASDA
ncbi:MAG: hypothetical protein U0N89_07310, partial [Collinsella intestinalis]